MNEFKTGDFVYFSLSSPNEEKLFMNSGIIINTDEEVIHILSAIHSCTNTIYTRNKDYVRPIFDREKIVEELTKHYNNKIEEYQSKIKSVKRIDYKDEISSKYYKLKEEIINTARNLVESKDDYEFENKLKAICQKKKQIFTIECEGLNDARKYNGEMKHNIKELIRRRDNVLNDLDKSINNLKNNFSK